jgi:hypothetical protein
VARVLDAWAPLAARSKSRGVAASQEELGAFEARAGFSLHDSVRSAWGRANGFTVEPRTKILTLAEATEWLSMLPGRPLFPFTDRESNPYCVACDPVLDGRILKVFHDDNCPQLAFRTLDDFARSLASAVDRHGDAFELDLDLDPEYAPRTPRTAQDVAAGRRLLATMGPRVDCLEARDADGSALFYVHVACTLLDDPLDVAPLLEWRNEYARAAAESRLSELDAPAAREALCTYDEKVSEFESSCLRALQNAGISATLTRRYRGSRTWDSGIKIGPPTVHLNTTMFYNGRLEPGAMDRLIVRAHELMELKNRSSR